jgi:transcriptional regulator with XRE-family HTH domain
VGFPTEGNASWEERAVAKRNRLASRRKALGLTQQALARLLDVDRSTVARWERGEANPLPWIRPKLATKLRVSIDGLEELLATGGASPAAADSGTASADAGDPDTAHSARQLQATAAGFAGRTGEPAALAAIPDDAAGDADAGDGGPGAAVTRTQQRLDKTSRELATAVARQWTAEAVMRSLGRPEPIQLSWSVTPRTAALPGQDPSTGEPVPPALYRDLSGLITAFRQLPKRQLVLLGEPGAGKTALAVLLILGLLANPEPGEPVPVLLPVSSWDPRKEHLYTWLARKLTEEYPGLGNTAAYGPHAAQRLVTDEPAAAPDGATRASPVDSADGRPRPKRLPWRRPGSSRAVRRRAVSRPGVARGAPPRRLPARVLARAWVRNACSTDARRWR